MTGATPSDMRILFLCSHNACRSQMAEGFARARKVPGLVAESAGLESTQVHPMAIRAMAEIGVDISGQTSTTSGALDSPDYDVVIAMSREAAEQLPVAPGRAVRVNWGLSDPDAMKGDEQTVLGAFRQSRDEIRRLVDDLFDRGYLAALVGARRCETMILENITDGIIAHDIDRKIRFFNQAAETITGYSRDEVLNRDCHDVFPGSFCGGKCEFSRDVVPEFDSKRREVEVATRSGERRLVSTTVRAMLSEEGKTEGVLMSFHDITRERRLARRVGEIQQFSGIIGRDESMLEIFDLIRDLAETNVPVLVQGESGTGKELVAAAIHNEGPRANKLFVPVNCGALPESLLESELFGHVKGAFTGAIRDKKGRFELADGGTIFLDEIGDVSPPMQVKLLRVLQEGTFERVGGEQTMRVDVRVISATNKNLTDEIAAHRFREDLYYRLSVMPLWLPALRERRNDIPLLAEHVLKRVLEDNAREKVRLSDEALDMMMSYDWPGNVRELQNWIQFALVKCKGDVILPAHLPPPRFGVATPAKKRRRRKLDIESVRAAIRECGGNKVKAADVLGVSRATLYRFMGDAGLMN